MQLASARLGAVVIAIVASGCTAPVAPGSPESLPGQVSCQDSRGPALSGDGRAFGPVQFQGLTDVPIAEVPRAVQVGVALPRDNWYFRKLPLAIEPGIGTVTISVSGESALAAWTGGATWLAGVTPVELVPVAGSTLTIQRCPGTGNYLYGGLAAARPTDCFDVTVGWDEGAAPKATSQRLNLMGAACS